MDQLFRTLGSLILCGFNGTALPADFRSLLEQSALGGVILFARNYQDRSRLIQLTSEIHSLSPAPVLVAVDQEGGRVVRFAGDFPTYPSPRYYGLRHDLPGLLHSVAQTASFLRDVKVNLNLVPVCDLAPSDSLHVIHSRSYSDDASELAEAVDLQVRIIGKLGLSGCAKHFPGLATAHGDPHFTVSRSDQSRDDFRRGDYVPFRAAVGAGVDMIMTTHLFVPKIDPDNIATFSSILVEQELRHQLGFGGLVVTDDLLMAGALEGLTPAEAGIKAILAGSDILIYSDLSGNILTTMSEIDRAARQNTRLERRIMESGERIGRFKFARLKEKGE